MLAISLILIIIISISYGYSSHRRRHVDAHLSLQYWLNHTQNAVWICDQSLTIQQANPIAQQWLSASHSLPVHISQSSQETAQDELMQLTTHESWTGELWFGVSERQPCQAEVIPLPNNCWLISLQSNAQQIQQRQQARLQLTDADSGLPNQAVLELELPRWCQLYQQHCHSFALVLIELPELPQLVSLFDSQQRTKLWQQICANLLPELPLHSLLCHQAQQQLALLIPLQEPQASYQRQLEFACYEVRNFLQGPYELQDHEVRLQVRIGAAIFPDAGTSSEELFAHANQALWQARQQPHQQALWQANKPHVDPLQSDLQMALRQYQCEVHYYPVHHLESNQQVAVTAELVWHHPIQGELPWSSFALQVQQLGLTDQFECWLIEQAGLLLSQLPSQAPFTLRIQLDGHQLLQGRRLELFRQWRQQFNVLPSQVTLCFNEQGWLEEPLLFARQCQLLANEGFRLSLVQFGEGLSPLKLLTAVPWHDVEISQRLIQLLEESDSARHQVTCLVRLLHAQQIHVIADGVEQEMQAYLLHVIGVHDIRGPFIGAPLSADALVAKVSNNAQAG